MKKIRIKDKNKRKKLKDLSKSLSIPTIKLGKMKQVWAMFFPKRTSVSFFSPLKEFLEEIEGAHKCPHDLYTEAASWWLDTGMKFKSINFDESKYEKELDAWMVYLESKGIL